LPDGNPRERPAWLSLEGHRHALAAPALCSAIVPCLIEAHATDDPDDAVAADRCVVRDTDRCVLFLRPGAYRLRGSDAAGRFLDKTTIRLAPRD
jgi:hypothetical protein